MDVVAKSTATPRRTTRRGRHPDKALSAAFVRSATPGRCQLPRSVAEETGSHPPAAAGRGGGVPMRFVLAAVLTANMSANAQEPLQVLWKTSDPPVITAAHRGPISFEFVLPGDIPEVWFHPLKHVLGYDTPERWTRTTTHADAGHLTSIFQATFDEVRVVDDVAYGSTVEKQNVHDFSSTPLGYLALNPEYTRPWKQFAHVGILRAPLNLPPSSVQRINAEVQYSSHVVNLVVPTYANDAATSGYKFQEIARRFYVYFGDDYDTLGVIPYAMGVNSSIAYHDSVQNRIRGLGSGVHDRSRDYGSLGRLRSMHMYPWGVPNYIVIHETAHHWWEFWDWEGVAGVDSDNSHGPRLSIPAIGRQHGRLVVSGDDVQWRPVPRRHSIPYLQSPVALYKMGYIGPEDVPSITVFEESKTVLPGDTTPTASFAPLRTVSINDFIARHGIRSGPVEGESWRMAVIVVTRDRLLSREMMSVYNYMAARVAALPGFGPSPSFFEATDGHMRMHTHVRPKGGPRLEPPVPVDVMPFLPIDAAEIPRMRFDSPLSTRILAGADPVVDGEITDESMLGDAGPTQICGHWVGDQMNWAVEKRNCSGLSRSGRFHLEWDPFAADQVGVYSLRLSGFQEFPVEIHNILVTVGSDIPTTTSAGQDRLVGGQRLYPGQFIRAQRAACRLELRTDGDLIAYADGLPYWNTGSGSVATGGPFAVMQHDGNFVIRDTGGSPTWSTRTGGNPGARLAIESDCNVVVRSSGGDRIWASGQP